MLILILISIIVFVEFLLYSKSLWPLHLILLTSFKESIIILINLRLIDVESYSKIIVPAETKLKSLIFSKL